jgi:Beta barrel domain of bacteriophage endosialidase.
MSEQHPGQPSHDAPQPRRLPKWVGYLIAVVLLFGVPGACGILISADGPSQASTDHDARRVCQEFVQKRLASPGSAEFSDVAVSHVVDDYTVTGVVDSDNLLGATVRNEFTCNIRSSGDQWRLTSLTGLTN